MTQQFESASHKRTPNKDKYKFHYYYCHTATSHTTGNILSITDDKVLLLLGKKKAFSANSQQKT